MSSYEERYLFGSVRVHSPDEAGIAFGLGVAASSAPIFAIGSIAKSTRRSAEIIEWMAEQENRRRAATPDT